MNHLSAKSFLLMVFFSTGLVLNGNASGLLARYTVDGDGNGILTDSSGQSPAADGTWLASDPPFIEIGPAGFAGDVLKYPPGSNATITLAESTGSGRLATDFSAEGGFTIKLRVSVTSLEGTPALEFLVGRWNASLDYRSFLLGLRRNANDPNAAYHFFGAISENSIDSIAVTTAEPIVEGGIYDVSFVYIPGASLTISAFGVDGTKDIEAVRDTSGIPPALFTTSQTLPTVEPVRIGGAPGISSLRNASLDNVEISANIENK